MLNDYCKCFDNYKALKNDYPKLAKNLIKDKGQGEWMKDDLLVFPSLEDLAKYEVNEGWYSEIFNNADYNGAPDITNYIDYDSLGEDLSQTWDDSCHYLDDSGRVVMTEWGF